MNKAKPRKARYGLKAKTIVRIMLIAVILCAATSWIGYARFTSVLKHQYNETAHYIAETARTYVDPDKLEFYLETRTKDAAYYETQKKLDSLVKTTDARLIYVGKIDSKDDLTLSYIFDSVNPKSNFSRYPLGYTARDMDPRYVDDIRELITTGESADSYRYSNTPASGLHTSVALPIYNSKHQIVAIVGVEKAMKDLDGARITYVGWVIGVSLLLVIVFVFIYSWHLNSTLIGPILTITEESQKFIDNEAQVSAKLLTVKNKDEIGSLARAVHKMESDIKDYIDNLTQVTAEKERISAELNVATQIQADMLPRIFPFRPDRPEFDLYASMDPAKEVGGDFYDYFMVDDDHLAMVVGDVSGKGVPAALFMVISKTLIKNYTMMQLSPEDVFKRTNNDLCEGNEAGLFTTAWLGVYELSTGILRYTEAGHDAPLRRKPNGTVEYIKPKKKKMVLAAMEDIPYIVNETELVPGDTVLVYTDGVTEATNKDNELFGLSRLEDSMKRNTDTDPKELLQHIREDVDAFVGEAPQFDDLTMLAVEINSRGETDNEH